MILSFEQVGEILDEIADSFPKEFYKELNGAVLLLSEPKHHPSAPDLSIMGTYCRDHLGRYIEIYYGSFVELAQAEDWDETQWRERLQKTLSHEFTHHLESLAGERALEDKDADFMQEYWSRKNRRAAWDPEQ